MTRPPLTLALTAVLTASIDQATRLGLLASLYPATAPPAQPILSLAPPLADDPAPSPLPSQQERLTREAAPSASRPAMAGPTAELATVLTMPRVIPMPRQQQDGPEPGPSAA